MLSTKARLYDIPGTSEPTALPKLAAQRPQLEEPAERMSLGQHRQCSREHLTPGKASTESSILGDENSPVPVRQAGRVPQDEPVSRGYPEGLAQTMQRDWESFVAYCHRRLQCKDAGIATDDLRRAVTALALSREAFSPAARMTLTRLGQLTDAQQAEALFLAVNGGYVDSSGYGGYVDFARLAATVRVMRQGMSLQPIRPQARAGSSRGARPTLAPPPRPEAGSVSAPQSGRASPLRFNPHPPPPVALKPALRTRRCAGALRSPRRSSSVPGVRFAAEPPPSD